MAMRKIGLGLLTMIAVLLGGCDDDEGYASLTISLVPTYHGQKITSEQVITDKTGRNFYLRDMRVYISDLNILTDNGDKVLLEDLALMEWPGTKSSFQVTVPKDDYQGVEFYIGLDSVTNSALPTDFEASHPLSAEQDMHWGMMKYRFLIFEGSVDTSVSGDLAPQRPLSFHLGRDALFTKVKIIRNVPITGIGVFFTLNFEVNDMFDGDAGTIDISVDRVNYSGEAEMLKAGILMSNFADSFQPD
ncbi:MAG: hypothetical protein GY748_25525 [Planctomycetaceae bacterium]|nr:hypothetical protein [Planctomycetaceae bacterium]